jgi:2-polyprenyl-6-methoxyphenol hydroxylase-like FAD-dependent oxidoreductase
VSGVDVLVVGAGPSGLTLANVLSAGGAEVRLIDGRPGPVDESRAAIVHVRTLEAWQQLGVADTAIARGIPVREVSVSVAGRALVRFPLTGPRSGREAGSFDHALALPQNETERILGAALEHRGGRVTWQTRLVGLEQHADGVTAIVRGPDGAVREIPARFVAGADGARSLARRAAGIGQAGGSYAPTAFLADVSLDPQPRAGVVHLNLAKGGFVGILALGPDRFRLFGALSPAYAARFETGPGERVEPATLQRWFDEYFGVPARIGDVGWTSTYRIHHRLAEHFRADRVFLVGDAAHVHAPAGGQGMNLGIGDAMNLGWKLAATVRGYARPALLDTYEAERRSVAEAVLRNADRGFEIEASDNRFLELFRRTVAPVAIRGLVRLPVAQRMIFRLFAQTWITYRKSALATQHPACRSGPRAGDRIAPDLLGADPGVSRHRPLLVTGAAKPAGVASATPTGVASAIDGLVGRCLPADPVTTIGRDTPRGRRLAGVAGGSDRIVLARPDGHAGYVGPADDLAALGEYLDRWYLPGGAGGSRLR